MLHWLGVKPSYSRPRVSDDNAFDDNAFMEAVLRAAKYRSEFPKRGFATLESARAWANAFVHWSPFAQSDNHEHAHSGILYVSGRRAMPEQTS